ncbi:hypothetical protein A3D00_03880 [Candidatus Woesebacteria bacterium RIFCSPHIGHO2_02_FULL_38_9]|uniref:Methyltransferase small domain-containing protein n=1 Tax=Candidatus Woesebacteria bacterium RIFCSPHIGHO2_01_FULL_39_28 TaxID=1802496 RepID=A0A1F7YEY9_9BACT|nr:MAG: hypothetical protein A2627_00305 [Candidatus Woesebacteria bacterium RIFCSPHIGHO2_01_FULL_39_28]OGM31805.1 MAG: hypothetical protein A3D00_03880 [Candidatus Woesebacteria bacterium RIFCSPHIGHO2_02_FULL_38_9]OGM56825.1 MAG: hypothetical protein A3A50_03850 [Candidatus Woesebacteria bacterium RIFCSPLOWO2_01_FULL_38_20]
MRDTDVYFKKTVQYEYRGFNLQFRTSQDLFSSYGIDIGTQRLLRTLTSERINVFSKVLDFGCGYGPIGIALKTVCRSSVVHMVDKDALAISYSRQNAELNNVNDIKIYPSLGFDDIKETDFDLIVSNIPAKVGESVLSHILKDAQFHLSPHGKVAIVVIDTISTYVAGVLKDLNIKILFSKKWPGHVVYHYEFTSNIQTATQPIQSAFDRGIYDRGEKAISTKSGRLSLKTAYGLAEFDTLSYETEMIINKLSALIGHKIDKAIVFNPGQGYLPVTLSKYIKVGKIFLIDRNLLALRNSRRNLILNKYPSNKISFLHQVGVSTNESNSTDCIIGILDDKDSPDIHKMLLEESTNDLSKEGLIMLVSSSTPITRLESFIRSEKLLKVIDRERYKGKSLIIFKRK